MTSSLEPTVAFRPVAELMSRGTGHVALENDIVDVWSCSLQGDAAVLEHCHLCLSDEERARAARFLRREDQTQFTFAHGGLRVVLARYVGMEPAALRFLTGPTGKPVLRDQQGGPHSFRFNLSHSHGRMLVAVAGRQDVGIDLERVRDNSDPLNLAERFYTLSEYERIKHLPVSDHALEFYRLWVAKEALLKAQGMGIPSLGQCEILASASSSRADVRIMPESEMQRGWTVQWLSCGPGWQGAVSTYGNDWSIRILTP